MILVKKQDSHGARGSPRGRSRGRGMRGTSQRTQLERSTSKKRARTPEKIMTMREKRIRGAREEEELDRRTELEEEENNKE